MQLTELARGILEAELKRLQGSRDIYNAKLADINKEKSETERLLAAVDGAMADIQSVLDGGTND